MHPERSVLQRIKVPKNQRSIRTPRAAGSPVTACDMTGAILPTSPTHDRLQPGSPVKLEAAEKQDATAGAARQLPTAASRSPRPVRAPTSASEDAPAPAVTEAASTMSQGAAVPVNEDRAPSAAVSHPVATAAPAAPSVVEVMRREQLPTSPRGQRPAAPVGKSLATGARLEKNASIPHSPRGGPSHHAKAAVKSPKLRTAERCPKGALLY